MKNYLLIQAIGLMGTLLFFVSFQCKSNKNLFRVQFVSYLCYTIHLLLLGAVTGGISYILNTLRSFCLGSKSEKLKSKWMGGAICILQLAAMPLHGPDGFPFFPLLQILRRQLPDIHIMRAKSALPECLLILLFG